MRGGFSRAAFTMANSVQRKVRPRNVGVLTTVPDCCATCTAVLKHLADVGAATW